MMSSDLNVVLLFQLLIQVQIYIFKLSKKYLTLFICKMQQANEASLNRDGVTLVSPDLSFGLIVDMREKLTVSNDEAALNLLYSLYV